MAAAFRSAHRPHPAQIIEIVATDRELQQMQRHAGATRQPR
jgi:hypothetical protein